ncbi:MAG: WD40/YVTN/BNR-like repeat-containing protein [Actinomycetota bacterium]
MSDASPVGENHKLALLLCLAVLSMAAFGTNASSAAGEPRWTGHGPVGGEVVSLAVAADGTVYAGTQGGVFRSTDGGGTWRRVGAHVQGRVASIAVHPHKPGVVYVIAGGDAFRSSDAGESWTRSTRGLMGGLEEVAIDPHQPFHVFAVGNGVFKSENGGRTWKKVAHGLAKSDSFGAVTIDPTGTVFVADDIAGVFVSADGGRRWHRAVQGFPRYSFYGDLAAAPAPPGVVFSATDGGIYETRDAGATWSQDMSSESGIRQVIADPVNPEIVYASDGAGRLFKTADGGRSWTESELRPDATATALAADPTDPSRLYSGSSAQGVYRSVDGAATWSPTEGFDASTVTAIAVDPVDSDVVVAGTEADGVFRSEDGGETWAAPDDAALGTFEVNAIQWMDGLVYLGTSSGPYRSEDRGLTWVPIGGDVLADAFVTAIAADPTDASVIYAGTGGGLLKTTDSGKTWHDTTSDLTGHEGFALPVTSIAIDPDDPDRLLLGTWWKGSDLFRSTDAAETWSSVGNSLPSTYGPLISTVTLDPADPGTIYVGLDRGVFKSTDEGQSWHRSSHGLPHWTRPLAIVVDPNSPPKIYVATEYGVFRSADAGARWTPMNSGLRTRSVDALSISGSTLYAGTVGSGAYSRPVG